MFPSLSISEKKYEKESKRERMPTYLFSFLPQLPFSAVKTINSLHDFLPIGANTLWPQSLDKILLTLLRYIVNKHIDNK